MCYKNFRLSALILILVLQLLLAACGNDSPATSTADSAASAGNTVPVVVFTDVHFNPFYDQSLFSALNAADASQWAGIFQTSSIKSPSAWGADTNYPLLMLALSGIQQNLGTSPVIVFTGDILGHNFPQTFFGLYDPQNAKQPTVADIAAMKAFTDKTVAFFMQMVRSSVGNIPVMFAVGNADSYTGIGPDSSFLSNNAELFYSQFLNGTVDHQTFITTFTSGGYYSADLTGTNLTVIGLNTFEFSPYFKGATAGAVNAELTWFDSTLASAQAKGKKVWLLMHVPPGIDKYSTAQSVDANGYVTSVTMLWDPNQDYQAHFLNILSKYPGLITQTLSAHTHMDEYRIMSPDNVAETTPSIAPYFGNNPAFKVFTVASTSWRATDYTSFNYDLATTPAQFNRYYTFSTAYHTTNYLNVALAQLYPELGTANPLQAFYRGSYFSGHNYTIPLGNSFNPITEATWPVYRCGIEYMDEQGLLGCTNSH